MEENINSVLNIEIKINNDGNLEVIDSTPYESLHEVGHVQHLILERAILNNDVPEVVA